MSPSPDEMMSLEAMAQGLRRIEDGPLPTKDEVCFVKARSRGQQTFTLVAQDITAARTIMFWLMENIETAPDEKLRDAFEDALRMRHYGNRRYAD